MEEGRRNSMAKVGHNPETVLLKPDFFQKETLRYVSVDVGEIVERGKRLDASYFDIDGKKARQIIANGSYAKKPLFGENAFAGRVYHFPRFKRIFIKDGIPIFTASQILDLIPRPEKFISARTKADLEGLTLKEGQIVITCSGSIGFCSIATKTLRDRVFSHDLIRIECNNPNEIGYVYAFLRTKIGQKILSTNNYGSVVIHIEPEHLANIIVPDLSENAKTEIHRDIMQSFELRDEANALFKQAETLLMKKLQLPALNTFKPEYLRGSSDLRIFDLEISKWQYRLDSSFHSPLIDEIVKELRKSPFELTNLMDSRVSNRIILPGRFKRIYVSSEYGVPFLSSGDILQFHPVQKKYLSSKHHSRRIKEQLKLHQNMILVSCSGTVGNVVLAPKHFEGWTGNQHILRIVPSKDINPGYIYSFLTSSYGKELVKRFTYGSVVNEIDDKQLAQVEFPLASSDIQNEIGDLVLEANNKWTQAYTLEKDATTKLEILIQNPKKIE